MQIASHRVALAVVGWLLGAVLVSLSGVLRWVRPPLPPVLIFSLTAVILLLFWRSSGFRAWALSVDIRALVLIHVSRFVGVYFLVLYARGDLPYAFAVPGGIGDIVVAAGAVAVLLLCSRAGVIAWVVMLVWNACGLLDILVVVLTAARLGLANPESMRALLVLPLSLLPTFLVPIIISTHFIIFVRLGASRRSGFRAL
jgi:hypothetical protein